MSLSDAELGELASRFVASRYGVGSTPTVAAYLHDPDGIYFSVDSPAVVIGDGGFFIRRSDGNVRHFGSGDLAPIVARRVALEGVVSLDDVAGTIAEALRVAQGNAKPSNEEL